MRTKESQPTLSSLEVAAKMCDVHPRTIRRWISQGRIRAYRVGPRLIKVDLAELNRVVQPVGGAV